MSVGGWMPLSFNENHVSIFLRWHWDRERKRLLEAIHSYANVSGNSNANKFMTRSEFDMKYHWHKVASHTKRGKRNQFRLANLIWISKRIISSRKEWDENQRVFNMISSKFNKRIVLMSMSVVIISAHQRNINYDDVVEKRQENVCENSIKARRWWRGLWTRRCCGGGIVKTLARDSFSPSIILQCCTD